ncbi:MAG TPA: peptide deformylase [Gemmatimonadota bacterium]|nr:peptide deformylase [Gemmatimonadota bacterium]
MIRAIRLLGDPALRAKARQVERFDEELSSLVDDLLETMYAAEGVGLAAPQIGDPRRVTVIDVSEPRDGSEALVLVNPRVLEKRGTIASEEGCLSIPGVIETIERAAEVDVEYQEREGARLTVSGTELLARALQHEIDHLNGILFIDHLGALKRRLVVHEFKKALEESNLEVGSS